MLKKKRKSKKSQTVFGMSFSVIFSILLIVFFIVIAFIAIRHFLGLRDCAKVGLFIEDFQDDIDTAWNSQKFSDEFTYTIPGNLNYVCFANLSEPTTSRGILSDIVSDISIYKYAEANMFFYPRENSCDMPYYKLKHINITKITESRNPYCIENDGGVVITIEKGFNEGLVELS